MEYSKLAEDSPFTLLEAAGLTVGDVHARLIKLCNHLSGDGPEFDYTANASVLGLFPLSAEVARQIHERAHHMNKLLTTIEQSMGMLQQEMAPTPRNKQWQPRPQAAINQFGEPLDEEARR